MLSMNSSFAIALDKLYIILSYCVNEVIKIKFKQSFAKNGQYPRYSLAQRGLLMQMTGGALREITLYLFSNICPSFE